LPDFQKLIGVLLVFRWKIGNRHRRVNLHYIAKRDKQQAAGVKRLGGEMTLISKSIVYPLASPNGKNHGERKA